MVVNTDIIDDSIDYNYSIQFNNNYNIQNNINKEENVFYLKASPLSTEEELFLRGLCKELDFNFHVILGLIQLESQFNKDAKGYNDNSVDIGYMQLNSKYGVPWAEKILNKEINPYDSYDNISGGMAILYTIRKHYANKGYRGQELLKMTLLAYNRGIQGANNWINNYGEYHAYVKVVLSHASKWEEELKDVSTPIKIINF